MYHVAPDLQTVWEAYASTDTGRNTEQMINPDKGVEVCTVLFQIFRSEKLAINWGMFIWKCVCVHPVLCRHACGHVCMHGCLCARTHTHLSHPKSPGCCRSHGPGWGSCESVPTPVDLTGFSTALHVQCNPWGGGLLDRWRPHSELREALQ